MSRRTEKNEKIPRVRNFGTPVKIRMGFFANASKKCYTFLLLHRALWNRYIVHSPTNALFIKLGKV